VHGRQMAERLVGELRQMVEAPHVARNTKGIDTFGTQALDGLLQRRHIDIGDDDPGTPGAEFPRRGEADSARATRYDRATTLDSVHRRTLCENLTTLFLLI
jgi:hypothetical protein